MNKRNDLLSLENELLKTFKRKNKAKKFVPHYKTTTYNNISLKWYITSDNSIKIVNGKNYDWYMLEDEYQSHEEFIMYLLKKQ